MPKRNQALSMTASVLAEKPEPVSSPIHRPLLYSFDAGNGTCKALSSESNKVIQVEPILAPLSTKRGLASEDSKPCYTLKEGNSTLVFGVDDVFAFGRRTAARRLNSAERYTSPDYPRLIGVLFLNALAAYKGTGQVITPTGVLSVPVGIYNNDAVIQQMRNVLVGKRELLDADGCALLLDIQPRRLLILPESYGALIHAVYDPETLKKRQKAETTGTTLVVDVGFESTDFSLYEGLKFQRDRAESLMRAGMGVVVRMVHEAVEKSLRSVDPSRIDRPLRDVAGKVPGSPKIIEPVPGVFVDVKDAYDAEIENLAARIAQETLTRYPEAVTRILLAGGGAYHLQRALRQHLHPLPVEVAPDADLANVYGGYTALRLQLNRVVEE